MMKKILVIPTDRGGTSKFRMVDPNICLNELFPEEYHVDIDYRFDPNDDNNIKKYDAIIFQKMASNVPQESSMVIKKIKALGVKVIVDTDDYWELDKSHGLYYTFKKNNIGKYMIETYGAASAVTCSTKTLYNKIKKYNPNVFHIPNAVNPEEKQFQPNKTESKRLRIGYIGGSSHLKDLEQIKSIAELLYEEFKNDLQFVLCGFDLRGTTKTVNEKTGEVTERPISPTESVWTAYEMFVTDEYRTVMKDEAYMKELMLFDPNRKIDDLDKPYKRVWTRSITEYANGYNEIDIMLAPLKENEFNLYKSNLKVLEAGFHKVPIIASNYGPYQEDIVSSYQKGGTYINGNGFLVDANKNHKDWARFIKYLLNNRDKVKELGENLYNTVKDKYDLRNVTKDRKVIYDSILK